MADLEMTYEDLVNEVDKAQKRAAKAVHLETKTELSLETYPLLSAIVEFFGERLDRTERAVAEIINQTESLVQPELAEQIIGTLNIGRQLATVVTKLRTGNLDAVTLGRLKQFSANFLAAAAQTEEAVLSVTLEPEGPLEEGDEGDEEDTDGGEGQPEGDESEEPIEVTLPDSPPPNELEAPAAVAAVEESK